MPMEDDATTTTTTTTTTPSDDGCPGKVNSWWGDNYCDDFMNNEGCEYDLGDCCQENPASGWDNYCEVCCTYHTSYLILQTLYFIIFRYVSVWKMMQLQLPPQPKPLQHLLMTDALTKLKRGGVTITVMTSWTMKGVSMTLVIAARKIQHRDGITTVKYVSVVLTTYVYYR